MPDEYDDEDSNETDSSVIKDLRKQAKRANELDAEVKQLRQESAILRAGIPGLTPIKQKALLAAHEGELDPESLRKTAIELGYAEDKPAAEAPQVPADEQAAHQRAAEATAAAAPSEAHLETLDDVIAKAQTPAELRKALTNAGMYDSED